MLTDSGSSYEDTWNKVKDKSTVVISTTMTIFWDIGIIFKKKQDIIKSIPYCNNYFLSNSIRAQAEICR